MQKEAADAIVRHNMFVAKKEQEIDYRKRGMDILIPSKSDEHLISLEKEPFTFLLGLVDTIEPMKRFECVNSKWLLEGFIIDIDSNAINIQVPMCLDSTNYFQGIDSLDKWLNVQIHNTGDYRRTIEIVG